MRSLTTTPLTNTRKCANGSRWTFHFTPTSASWLNAVEGFFAKLTNRRLKRGVFRSVADLEDAINRFVAETNADPKPFVWTARQATAVGRSRAAEGVRAGNLARHAASTPEEVTRASGFGDHGGRRQAISVACRLAGVLPGVVLEKTR